MPKMKFCKKYEEYMRGQERKLHGVELKRLKKILKKCRGNFGSDGICEQRTCPNQCSVCDGTFFPFLLKEMSAVVGCFNERAEKLLDLHLSSGFKKYIKWLKGKSQKNHDELIEEGKDLVTYALINAVAIRKILKKYDKIHLSKQGQAFKSQAQSMHIEILQSPWLCELMAFHINLRETENKSRPALSFFGGCSLVFDDGKPSLTCQLFDSVKLDIDLTCSICLSRPALSFLGGCSLVFDDGKPSRTCQLFDSVKLDIDLTCSICLDTVFDPVSLKCGHIYCYMCACSAASVTTIDGLKSAKQKAKCPLCREEGVFADAVHLEELGVLLSRCCSEYWEKRLQSEREERVRQAKEHWESQCRAFMGV